MNYTMTDKEKKLLDFVYEQGRELLKFLDENEYGKEYHNIGYSAYCNGYVNASFCNLKKGEVSRVCTKTSVSNHSPRYEEYKYEV